MFRLVFCVGVVVLGRRLDLGGVDDDVDDEEEDDEPVFRSVVFFNVYPTASYRVCFYYSETSTNRDTMAVHGPLAYGEHGTIASTRGDSLNIIITTTTSFSDCSQGQRTQYIGTTGDDAIGWGVDADGTATEQHWLNQDVVVVAHQATNFDECTFFSQTLTLDESVTVDASCERALRASVECDGIVVNATFDFVCESRQYVVIGDKQQQSVYPLDILLVQADGCSRDCGSSSSSKSKKTDSTTIIVIVVIAVFVAFLGICCALMLEGGLYSSKRAPTRRVEGVPISPPESNDHKLLEAQQPTTTGRLATPPP